MIQPSTLVFLILAATIALFVSDRLRLDLVALMSLLALALTGVVTPAEALAGFADPIVLMIAGLFVVGGALFDTGVAARIGHGLGNVAGTNPLRLTAVVMLSAAALSGFMSSTGTVAVMLPVVASLAWNARISPSKLLIPLSFGSLLGGLLTLIGTAPNIVVANALESAGHAPFRFFDFTPIGLVMIAGGTAFMLLFGRRLLPARAPADGPSAAGRVPNIAAEELMRGYRFDGLTRLRVRAASPLIGRTSEQSGMHERHGVNVVRVRREASAALRGGASALRRHVFAAGDLLDVQAADSALEAAESELGLERVARTPTAHLDLAEVMLTPRSRIIGQTVAGVRFRDRYGANVLALTRGSDPVPGDIANVPLRFGDTLLVTASARRIEMLRNESLDFVVAARSEPRLGAAPLSGRARIALAIMAGMMLLLTFEVVPGVIAVLLAAVAMVLTRCVAMDDAYRHINWESVVLIAAILPMATALDNTGGMDMILSSLEPLGAFGPLAMAAGLFVLTTTFSQVISNTATTVLVAPLAIGIAAQLGVSPYPLLMTVAVAASTAFATPIASPVNTLVLGPGAYRFGDFFRVGALLQFVIFFLTLLIVPRLFPF
jgi:di/tricarboxylate transporter